MNLFKVLMTVSFILSTFYLGCNPFAPELDTTIGETSSLLGDQRTVEGVFQNITHSYQFRDTTLYGQLLDPQFIFVYRDYERAIDVSWGRDEEMRATYLLFQNVQRLDLVWNKLVVPDTGQIPAIVTRNFNLTVTFNPGDIVRADGYAQLTLMKNQNDSKWYITRWRDESNF
jgi:hypothetical protein